MYLLLSKMQDKKRSTLIGKVYWPIVGLVVGILFCFPSTPLASATVKPENILVVVNRKMAGAEKIARYYMNKRAIPATNIFIVSTTITEIISRNEYNQKLHLPLQNLLRKPQYQNINSLVLIHGIPLKVRPPKLTKKEMNQLTTIQKELDELTSGNQTDPKKNTEITSRIRRIKKLSGEDKRAAVDSELSLVKAGEYGLRGSLKNPHFQHQRKRWSALEKEEVMLVSRLDAPSTKDVYRLIDDSYTVEQEGLQGVGYFDARWQEIASVKLTAYTRYDSYIHKTAAVVSNQMDVILNQQEEVFAPQSCPNAALYTGWYSLGSYVDSFSWVRGAVGYHIASGECTTLRNSKVQAWCVQMIQRGVVATIGPVYEPYLQAFPPPDLFFALLIEGKSLGESYLKSLPSLSWQMVLVGDPLYTPFKKKIEN